METAASREDTAERVLRGVFGVVGAQQRRQPDNAYRVGAKERLKRGGVCGLDRTCPGNPHTRTTSEAGDGCHR